MHSIARLFCPARIALLFQLVGALSETSLIAWDYDGHRLISVLAQQTLPTNFPAFILDPSARERIAFLSGEPDRWRNSPDYAFLHFNKPDHFFDVDDLHLYGLAISNLSPFRYEFTAQLAAGRAARPELFAPTDPRDVDRSRSQIGFLPWSITEYQGRLKSGFSYLRAFEEGGTNDEILNARQNIIYAMGVMSHHVGDAAQPLHTTRHFNGWAGRNPEGYTTNRTFHAWIDGGYLARLNLTPVELAKRLRPARRLPLESAGSGRTNLFPAIVAYIQKNFAAVEPLYRLEKAGQLSAREPIAPEAREFMVVQVLAAAQMLGDLWVTAWRDAPVDHFLKAQLARRTNLATRPPGEKSTGSNPVAP